MNYAETFTFVLFVDEKWMENEWGKREEYGVLYSEIWANLFELINKQNYYTSFKSF